MINLSVVVLAKNEENRIDECIDSIVWADQIIVLDNNSSDQTVSRAKKHGVTVVQTREKDFSALRMLGAKHATKEWILYVDADERVSDELKKKLIDIILNNDQNASHGYFIVRKNYYLGHEWPIRDKMHRLFVRKFLRGWVGEIHETAVVDGDVGTITEPLIHRTHRTLEEMTAKTNEWSNVEAKLRFDIGHATIVPWRLFRVFLTSFYHTFVNGGGWRAGTIGIIESIYQGFSMFITYAKLWELQKGKDEISA